MMPGCRGGLGDCYSGRLSIISIAAVVSLCEGRLQWTPVCETNQDQGGRKLLHESHVATHAGQSLAQG